MGNDIANRSSVCSGCSSGNASGDPIGIDRRNAVDAGIEIIQTDVYPVDFLRDSLQIIAVGIYLRSSSFISSSNAGNIGKPRPRLLYWMDRKSQPRKSL